MEVITKFYEAKEHELRAHCVPGAINERSE